MLHKKSKRWIILAVSFILGVILMFLFKTSFISFTIKTSAAERGKIIDQNGVILATNKKVKSLYYVYNIDCPADQEVAKISNFLNQFSSKFNHKISVDDINSQLQKSCKHHDKNEIRLHANLNDKEFAFINENNFKNIKVKNEWIRVYPHHEIASQVIGYVDYEKNNSDSNYVPVGKNGIELQYENDLKGKPGKTLTFKIKNKKFLWNIQSPQRGKDIQLALDYKLQQKTEKALRSQIQKTPDATAGYAVVIDVKTGEILTMANSPVFDPNIFNTPLSSSEKENIQLLAQNKTIQKLKYGDSYVNMASTIKPLTILIGLNEKLFQPEDTYLDKGRFQYNNQNNITNAAGTPTGEITPSQAIINSSNTFMTAKVAIPLFNQNNGNLEKVATVWTSYLKQFGLRSKTGIDLPFEEEGQYKLHASSNFESGISALLNASWGANEVHTTLQLAQYAAALANKGDKYKPQIVNAIMENGDKKTKEFKPILESSNRYPSRFWNVLQSGMSQNIQEIKNLPFDVAGKTGITSSPNEQEKVINHSLFISYAPTKNPHIAISVIIPGGNSERNSAALVAAEILKEWDTLQKENKK
ncbi:penicillin-binding protein [Bacillus pseudomycoides]|uniref:peptidoglycan D,D-transpeptidase FtsI family protein n=1 Tax=Bacillus sp. DHT2 TaxID=2994532 RepID=UPI0003684E33|nr:MULTISPECIES: penicillin-binding transpeptidase domain-containing protein [Bacillus]AIK37054.1 penicillin binding transpeptidase domain protein [Bacillus pseudomycoides]AJI16839.1 penicillin binding transpeptidase domain protein [Bacillus pseudomycoides]MDR4915597.1 penicillin-binding transpeptidase domain-containing protein [Bacillus pseudomycoides]PDX98123.1 penicillin-binding protein [Bacillus pseudomycoides]PEK82628.1 penicillin-binding protein [Bacillus pseudomycoides]